MKRHILFIGFLMMSALLFARAVSADFADIFYPNPYTVEPDSTKVIFPIPINTGNPLQDLNNQSPLYVSDPDNVQTECV